MVKTKLIVLPPSPYTKKTFKGKHYNSGHILQTNHALFCEAAPLIKYVYLPITLGHCEKHNLNKNFYTYVIVIIFVYVYKVYGYIFKYFGRVL